MYMKQLPQCLGWVLKLWGRSKWQLAQIYGQKHPRPALPPPALPQQSSRVPAAPTLSPTSWHTKMAHHPHLLCCKRHYIRVRRTKPTLSTVTKLQNYKINVKLLYNYKASDLKLFLILQWLMIGRSMGHSFPTKMDYLWWGSVRYVCNLIRVLRIWIYTKFTFFSYINYN